MLVELRTNPHHTDAYRILSAMMHDQGAVVAALRWANRGVQRNPLHGESLVESGGWMASWINVDNVVAVEAETRYGDDGRDGTPMQWDDGRRTGGLETGLERELVHDVVIDGLLNMEVEVEAVLEDGIEPGGGPTRARDGPHNPRDERCIQSLVRIAQVRGSWFVVRGSWFVVRGSWFVVRGSRFVVRG